MGIKLDICIRCRTQKVPYISVVIIYYYYHYFCSSNAVPVDVVASEVWEGLGYLKAVKRSAVGFVTMEIGEVGCCELRG